MKKFFFKSSLIIVFGIFPMQVSAMQECEIILKPSIDNSSTAIIGNVFMVAEYFGWASDLPRRGDILAKDAMVPLDWTRENPRNVRLHIEHYYYSGGSVKVNTGNELWAKDLPALFDFFKMPGENRIAQEGVIKASAIPTKEDAVLAPAIYFLFDGMKKPIRALPAWCAAPENERRVNIFLDENIVGPDVIELEVIRDNQTRLITVNKAGDSDLSRRVWAPYDIVRKIGVNVPPVVDFGRIDAGVVTKKDIDVELKYSGIPGRGYLTFNYADAKKMDVIINEKDDPQEHKLPYYKYLNGLRPNSDYLTYQIGVKSDTVGDIEQRIRVTFNVF
ncbi:hypothetical protein ACFJ4X_004429 [Salmonella enterica]|nr:hypothetical protein [Salmonella enterica subsp. enterica serovar Eastbourne]EBX9282927.1 hypothetical protein [Salmonella enterica subsp. enterica serovar Gaminara]ECA7285538.1 hypothetical protein [Salmonella enterica subsp. enterica serovar Schwarzengrund]